MPCSSQRKFQITTNAGNVTTRSIKTLVFGYQNLKSHAKEIQLLLDSLTADERAETDLVDEGEGEQALEGH